MSPYVNTGSLVTEEEEINDSNSWDDSLDWENYQVKDNISIVDNHIELSKSDVELDHPDAIHHYDASQEDYNDGDSVDTITDWLTSYDLTGGGATFIENEKNDNPVFQFTGESDELDNSNPSFDQPYTIIWVGYAESDLYDSDRATLISSVSGSNRLALYNNDGDYATYDGSWWRTDVEFVTYEWKILTLMLDYDGDEYILRINGDYREGDDPSTLGDGESVGGIRLGNGYSTAADERYFSGYISEIVIYEDRLSESEMLDEESRVSGKWNIPLDI